MTEEEKDRYEWHVLDCARRASDIFPSGDVQKRQPPDPDFIIFAPDRKFGIELRRFVRNDSHGKQEALEWIKIKRDIVRNARRIFESQHANNQLSVHFMWRDKFRIKPREQKALSSSVAELVARHCPIEPHRAVEIDISEYRELDSFECRFLYRIFVTAEKAGSTAFWESDDGGGIDATVKEVQDIISRKNSKIRTYGLSFDKASDQMWLLIHADATSYCQWAELPTSTREHIYCSDFDKILFYDASTSAVHELKSSPEPPTLPV